ncbi:zinc ribbon domain-containing protein [Tenacibaculum amylolyticum]|uniref:zinc ribbon domain-containing protein n=1 Tax=Tenacibaculum amylolyticum TaxID=104269 RepID=UPI003895D11C
MFCHNCGEKANEAFCAQCGTKVLSSDSKIIQSWRKESDYQKIVNHPDVLGIVKKYSNESKKQLTADEFIGKLDLVVGAFSGVPLGVLTEVIVPISKKLGLKTGKSKEIQLQNSIQEAFVKSICILTKNKHKIEEFHQAENGVILVGTIESDFWTWGGNIVIELEQNEDFITAKVQSIIKGQIYDWNKSKKVIHKILSDLQTIEIT